MKSLTDILTYEPKLPHVNPAFGAEPSLETVLFRYYRAAFDESEAHALAGDYISRLHTFTYRTED